MLWSAPLAGQTPRTRAERTAFRETSHYTDVVAFLDTLRGQSPSIVVDSIGTTNEGRAIPLVIASRPRVATPARAHALGRPIVYLNANIHAGEVEGKEAVLALLRDLAAESRPNVLDSVVLLAVPIYNADGNERFAAQAVNRIEQNGPDLVGIRANAQGLDLNRDYVKAEAPETRAFLAAWRAWNPDLYVDLHTTDGSYHGYALTYAPSLSPNADLYTRDVMLPVIRARMRDRQHVETFDYGNFDPDDESATLTDTVKAAWYSFDARPRFGTNYVGLRGRISILSEAFSHDPLERRVVATRAFLQEILSYAAEHKAEIRAVSRRADEPPRRGAVVSLRAELTKTPYTGPVIAEDLVRTGDSSETEPGVPPGIRRTGRMRTLSLPIYDRFVSTLDLPLPTAYVLGPDDTAAVRVLRLHGLRVDRLRRTARFEVDTFVIDSTATAPDAFQQHHQRHIAGRWVRARVRLAAGSYVVSSSQPAGRLAGYLLEPESDDGLFTWNVFDEALTPGRPFPVRRIVAPLAMRH